MARRLIEAGVTFVEVRLRGWDTHNDNFTRVGTLAEQVDPAFAQLVSDLEGRGLLESTLVVWMGEFGRTPRINPRTGRDHFPRAFNVALAGGGVRGGQVIGRTSDDGTEVLDAPVAVADLFCSFCRSLGIDPQQENMSPLGRPLKIVDGGAPVEALFG
jgi:arylsulfatase A-like enzyme